MKVEIEQQKEVLNQWNTWGQAKTDEYNQLLEAYNQYVESYTKLMEEITDLKTANENLNEIFTTTQSSLQEKQTELLEKNAEIERLKQIQTSGKHSVIITEIYLCTLFGKNFVKATVLLKC